MPRSLSLTHCPRHLSLDADERAQIEKYWEREGRPISPITREVLDSKTLFPNHNLKQVCDEFAVKHGRVKSAATDPADLVMTALLAPPTDANSSADGASKPSDKGGAARGRFLGKRPRKLDEAGTEAEGDTKRSCVAQ